ncbi:HEAT repeat domain-containing protein, partial [Candidatus Woesearchaeota archaeon]|nr:HEAT repeat domain-containing protein [Candidatus Woesearchaeota archaeon]
KNGNDRRLAASALGKLGKFKPQIYKAITALIYLLKDQKPQVRLYAVKALGRIATPAVIPQLKKLEMDEKEYIRKSVKRAVNLIQRREGF